jgi:hypothetical protein
MEVETREVGLRTRTEQANDERLLVRIYETIASAGHHGDAIVLATGDGNGWKQGHGFVKAIDFARQMGHATEIVSWRRSLNPQLSTVACDQACLDEQYYGLTFIERGRMAQPVFWFPRPVAPIGGSHAA